MHDLTGSKTKLIINQAILNIEKFHVLGKTQILKLVNWHFEILRLAFGMDSSLIK